MLFSNHSLWYSLGVWLWEEGVLCGAGAVETAATLGATEVAATLGATEVAATGGFFRISLNF